MHLKQQSERDRERNAKDLAERMARAGIVDAFANGSEGFHTFRPQNDTQANALKLAQQFANGELSGVFAHGPAGVGKTHVSTAAAARLVERGEVARFLSARQLALELRAAMAEGIGADVAVLRALSTVRYLVLDDLGTGERLSAFAAESLLSLIDARVQRRLPTFLTSNYSLRELAPRLSPAPGEKTGELICDRLREVCRVVAVTGASYRGQKALAI